MSQIIVEKKNQDILFWILIIYLFLEIVRAADVYSFLSDIRIQLVTIVFYCILAPFLSEGRKIVNNYLNFYVLLFLLSLFISSIFSLNSVVAWNETYNYFKLVVLYFIVIYCIKDLFYLKSFILCLFLLVTLYIVLSFREFLLGQHIYDMGVRRMLGWDGNVSPNRLGMMCAVFLPYSLMMLKKENYVELVFFNWTIMPWWAVKLTAMVSIVLSISCIILTRSRSSLILLFLYFLIFFYRSRNKILLVGSIVILVPFIINMLPEATKNRYMSILYISGIQERTQQMSREEEWSQTSAQGRIFGLKRGLELYGQYPLFGVGPGGFRYVSGNNLQAHNLLGQTAAEVGTFGLFSFVCILFYTIINLIKTNPVNPQIDLFLYAKNLRIATLDAFSIFFIGSFFGHTLFYSWWLLLGAISVLYHHFLFQRVRG